MPTEPNGPTDPKPRPAADPAPSAQRTEADDRELATRLRRGDPQALEALYDRYGGTVLALLRRIVGHSGEAEDLLQEVFLQAWRRAPEYDVGRGSFAAWIFTIARNRALDVVRAPRFRDRDRERQPPEEPVAQRDTPEQEVVLGERAQAVQKALSELSTAQREAIELAYYGGLSHSEIANKTGEPLGTIKSRLNQAAARLRAVLGHVGG